ncbi:MAG: hypothetical protein GYB21_07085 [Oceanospirillales bacterium]|nr:hypothetical protein [Oceanospirillales bacterium]
MKAIDTYQDTAGRAKRLLLLHDGLINTRQRSIRRDWKSSFNKLMHWKRSSEIQRVDSRDAVIVLREGSGLKPDDFTKESLDDLLRSSLTFGVSALDRYVHERVIKGFVSAYRTGNLNREQKEFNMPATLAMEIVEKNRRANLSGDTVRPANEIRKAVQEILHKRPFQNWREVEYGFCLIGVKGLAGKLQSHFGVGDFNPIRNQLNKIAERRNHIVHEGDLARHQRGGGVKAQKIERKFVEDSLAFLDDFVAALEQV